MQTTGEPGQPVISPASQLSVVLRLVVPRGRQTSTTYK